MLNGTSLKCFNYNSILNVIARFLIISTASLLIKVCEIQYCDICICIAFVYITRNI